MSRQKRKARRHLANGLLVLATSYSRTAYRRTTIGAAAFHCRVRNGNGWGHCATVTRVRNRTGVSLLSQRCKREAESLVTKIHFSKNCRFVDIYIQSLGTRTLRLRFVLDLSFPITAVSRLHEKQQRIGKVKDQAERVISTPELNMLPCLHPEPINVVVYHDPSGRSHLGIGLALRCFQHLSFPNIATQHCS